MTILPKPGCVNDETILMGHTHHVASQTWMSKQTFHTLSYWCWLKHILLQSANTTSPNKKAIVTILSTSLCLSIDVLIQTSLNRMYVWNGFKRSGNGQMINPYSWVISGFENQIFCKNYYWSNTKNIHLTLWILMAWCFSTRALSYYCDMMLSQEF